MADVSGPASHPDNDLRDASAIHLQAGACPTNTVQYSTLRQSRVTGNDQTGRNPGKTTGTGSTESGQAGYEFFLYNVPPQEKGRLKQTYPKPKTAQSVHNSKEVYADFPLSNTEILTEARLDGENRPFLSLLPCAYNRISPPVSTHVISRKSSPNDLPPLRPLLRTEELRYDHELGDPHTPRERYENFGLSRRLSFSQPVQSPTRKRDIYRSSSPGTTRLGDQLRKVSNAAYTRTRIPRYQMEHGDKYKNSSPKRYEHNSLIIGQNSHGEQYNTEGMSAVTRYSELCNLRYPRRKAKMPSSPKVQPESSKFTSESESRPNNKGKTGPAMVALGDRSKTCKQYTTRVSTPTLFNNRCCRLRMGSPPGRLHNIRKVEPQSVCMALQPQRNVRDNISCENLQTSAEGNSRNTAIGQPDCCCICTERGGDTITTITGTDTPTISAIAQLENNCNSRVPPGPLQSNSGQPITRQKVFRVAPSRSSPERNISEIRNTRDRSFCLQEHQGTAEVCIERLEGLIGKLLQCLQQEMGIQARMGISSSIPNPPCPTPSEYSRRYVPPCNSSLETSVLATRSSTQSTREAREGKESSTSSSGPIDRSTPSSSREHETFSMESWGWADTTNNWSEDEKSLLRGAWRESTLKTYKPAWLRWTKWCKNNNCDFKHPTGSLVAKYLAHLHLKEKLALSTILVHKSVILTLGSCPEELKSNFLIKHMLKAISLQQPQSEKSPIWDPSELTSWLIANPPTRINLYEISRRLACILLLASGRRVHDLTLLKVTSDHFHDRGDHIILWPKFGSKTDTATHRQSGWKLSVNSNSNICPVSWLRKLIEMGDQRRTAECDGALFISITGPSKAATRTLIANWIKTVFKDAGIKAPPGSFRSAVASLNWFDNLPMDEILLRGNWRSENTFAKFYCKQIHNRSTAETRSNELTGNFQPV